LSPVTTNDIDLGTASLEFKNAFFDGTVTSDAFAGPLTGNVTGNVSGTAATVTTAAQSNITSLGTLTTLTVDDITINGSTISDAGDFTLDVEGDIILDANGADVFLKDAGTTYGSLTNTSGNLIVKSGTTTALTFSGANVTVAGDLTVSGDDITMGTNTAGNLLIADGTNFNSVAATSLAEISTVASDDVFLAVDTSGGGLKKIARSAVVAGLATSSAISDIVEDTSPQLGGDLDTNSSNILIDDAHFIADDSGNEQLIFQKTGSAVNQFDITNAASGNGPRFSATGGDSNIDLDILAKGTGHVTIRGNSTSGTIQFNCESNSHGQIIRAQPHSASATNIMLLPEGADSTLVSLVSADTLTNKTLTAPKIADGGFIADANGNQLIVFQTTGSAVNELEITNNASGSNPILAATGGDTNIGIALTPKGTGEIVIGAANLNYAGTAVTSTGAELNLLDGITAGTVSASLAVIVDSDKDITGFRNVTLTGELDAATGDFSGAIDVAGTANLDVVDIDGAVDMATTLQVDGAITTGGLLTAGAKIDLNGTELILDADADTSITADTDDQIDIRLAGADDFTITANTFTILSGSTIVIAAGGGITNSGSMSSDITSTGKALVFGF